MPYFNPGQNTDVYTLHSDEVVSLLIAGCESVVYSCSPMAVVLLLHC